MHVTLFPLGRDCTLPWHSRAWHTECPVDTVLTEKPGLKHVKDQKVAGGCWSYHSHKGQSLQPQTCLGRVLFDLSYFKGDLIGVTTE